MSTTNLEHNEFVTCDLCKRRYNINVYKRHRNENQCVKRNHHRLPFESIKQRSVQIGDKIFSVQQQKPNDVQISNNRETRKQPISNNNHKTYQEQMQRILPSNNRRRTLEQAKQLLERRTKYKPPWIQKRSNFINDRMNTIVQGLSSKQTLRSSPPTTKFKNDDIPIKVSQQPILTYSPKIRTYQPNRVDQTFSHEQTNSASRPARKAYTWTRPSKQFSTRNIISPIQIPTFRDSSSGPSRDRILLPFNQNYDDDEFERYSPTPPSTPKYQPDKTEIKHIPPSVKQNFVRDEQQTLIRPITYQRAKRSEQKQQHEIPVYPHSIHYSSRKSTQSIFHLPPINPSSYPKLKHRPTINPAPWR